MKYLLSTLLLVSAAPVLAAQTEGPARERMQRPPHQQKDRVREERGEFGDRSQRGSDERQRPSREEIIQRFDANGDGHLDEVERERLRATVEAYRKELSEGGPQRREGLSRGGERGGQRGFQRGEHHEARPQNRRGGHQGETQFDGRRGERLQRPEVGGRQQLREGRGQHVQRGQGFEQGRRETDRESRGLLRQQLRQRFDANRDGHLDQQERQALRSAMEQRRATQGEARIQERPQERPQQRRQAPPQQRRQRQQSPR